MTIIDTLIEGFIHLMVNTIFGNALLFVIVFVLLIGVLMMISGSSIEQILIFSIIPVYSVKDTILTGAMGISFLAILGFVNAYFLYKHLTRIMAV